MGSSWLKVKTLWFNQCARSPVDDDDGGYNGASRTGDTGASGGGRASVADIRTISSSDDSTEMSDSTARSPPLRRPSSSGALRLFRSESRLSKAICIICLGSMKKGQGHALFTAECSHTFHFQCIATNVKHGNIVCPVCRAKWKHLPFAGPLPSENSLERARLNPLNRTLGNGHATFQQMLPRADCINQVHRHFSYYHVPEPRNFDDDEHLNLQPPVAYESSHLGSTGIMEMKLYPEFSAIPQSDSMEDFAVLIHLKAPPRAGSEHSVGTHLDATSTHAPVDLVTVLDVSGSMVGTKLELLKRAMGFVIENLGPLDRLSVIVFSSNAHRLFPLRRMTPSGKRMALAAVNLLVSTGGTNIAEGLLKAAKVLEERREQNPVCGIILLSDGQDNCTMHPGLSGSGQSCLDYRLLMPPSILSSSHHQLPIPIHTFGFGADHDSSSMHSISEISGGTFSFIESENVIQDAFAQCIGGLLSVVVNEMQLMMHCLHPHVRFAAIKSGSYRSRAEDGAQAGLFTVGNLYADEERGFLYSVSIPPSSQDTSLLKVWCTYVDAVSRRIIILEDDLRIQRPEMVASYPPSIEVDRERNRLQSAEAMSVARATAELGALSDAVAILEKQRKKLTESFAGQSGDQLCLALDAELRQMQEMMSCQQTYQDYGRVYLLSGLSTHSLQRATARGDSLGTTTRVHSYQTPSIAHRSQTFSTP